MKNNFFKTPKGLNEKIIHAISKIKNEPKWMLNLRLKAFETFKKLEMPTFGPNLSHLNFSSYTYFMHQNNKIEQKWNNVPKTIRNIFKKLGIPKAEQKYLAGITTQYNSEAIYHNMLHEIKKKGIIFLPTDQALQLYPKIFKKYFNTVIKYNDNKFAALNCAVWSGGSFIYVPKNVKLEKPLQSYFRINNEQFGQFERSLIIVDEGAEINYIEGCSAPIFSKDSLHAAVVEIIVLKNAKCCYSTIQNWSKNIINLVTKRAIIYENGNMKWIDGNIGGYINMKYPTCILIGENAKGTCITMSLATKKQYQDTGAKMIHLAPNTHSTIISKSIVNNDGIANYRGNIKHSKLAFSSSSYSECDTLILSNKAKSDTIPNNEVCNNSSYIEHEATISEINEEQLFYLMSRGINKKDAINLIIIGFITPFTKELPIEYAVEFNKFINLN